MFCCSRNPNRVIESMASLLALGAVVPLAFAVFTQFVLKLPPCHFCMLQRYPYALVAFAAIIAMIVRRGGLTWRFAVALGICGFLTTAIFGAIHTGIEKGWLNYSGGCVANAAAGGSIADLRNSVLNAPIVACDATIAEFLGVSMASWNVVFALAMIVLVALQYRYDRKTHG